eukprot:TRINITY_DN5784_c0_g1_i4.p1 TRINITY_DN5784_c0_g1~~TRINITY_DN5784_c0_g1_i4.p1  ORF type:complete len:126 (-),score=29.28 TRINITY_DN5784_c0_g1_i4:115-492(-)
MMKLASKQADGVVLVFDVTNKKAFEKLKGWIVDIESCIEESVVRALVGNKIDSEQRVIFSKEAEELAKSKGFSYYEASAKENKGVDNMFTNVIAKAYPRTESAARKMSFQLNRLSDRGNRSKCCS